MRTRKGGSGAISFLLLGMVESEMAAQARTNGRSVSKSGEWCTRSATGKAAVHVPWQLLVIHKLRLIRVAWCHLHHLPKGAVFNMGILLHQRFLCVDWATCVLYLYGQGFMCPRVCVNVPALVCEREQERVCCYAFTCPPTCLFTWNIVAVAEMNT